VNVKLVTRGNNAKKVRLTELMSNILGQAKSFKTVPFDKDTFYDLFARHVLTRMLKTESWEFSYGRFLWKQSGRICMNKNFAHFLELLHWI